jgi:molybdopterin synthase catalytic subunit
MRARVLFFGPLKDLVGRPAEEAEFPEGTDLRAVLESYKARYPSLRDLARSIVMARNREFADLSSKLAEGDEIAFLPPVSGGSDSAPDPTLATLVETCRNGNYFALTRRPIDARALAARLLTGAEGAVVTFEGTARNNTNGRRTLCLDYECYEPMALTEIARLGCEIAATRAIGRIGIVHRLGRVLIGEASVVVVATAAHRRPAFEAALEAIDRLKKTVPIWKKEHFADGEVWAEGEWDAHVPLAD